MTIVSIIGLGYMGLPMAALLAKAGHSVKGVDINPKAVDAVNAGKSHFTEPGLAELVATAHASGNLTAFTTPQVADIHVIAVPTPFIKENKKPDMHYVEEAAKSIASVLRHGDLVILESTSPVGATAKHVKAVVEATNPDLTDNVLYAFCPERAIPGDTLRELIHNDRSVGGLSAQATDKAMAFYKTFIKGELIATTATTAELVKCVENAYRDTNIAFANELSIVCEKLGLNVWEVIALANRHPRVNIMQPGAGVGGHCLAIDPWFIIDAAQAETPLMQAARHVNDAKPYNIGCAIKKLLQENPNAKVALMGFAYKPDVDDLRESPTFEIAEALRDYHSNLMACEPHIDGDTIAHIPLRTSDECIEKADIIVFCTAHSQFKRLSPAQMVGKIVVDPCGIFQQPSLVWHYTSV